MPRKLGDEADQGVPEDWFFENIRLGKWLGWNFDATTPGARHRLANVALYDAGLDLGYQLQGWTVFLSVDGAADRGVQAVIGGISIGRTLSLPFEDLVPIPIELQVSLGAIGGHLDVTQTGFGSFDNAPGIQGRALLDFRLSDSLGAALWADYRFLRFRYSGTVLSGDQSAPGSTLAIGVAATVRF